MMTMALRGLMEETLTCDPPGRTGFMAMPTTSGFWCLQRKGRKHANDCILKKMPRLLTLATLIFLCVPSPVNCASKTIGFVCDARPQSTENQSALTTDLNQLDDQTPGWIIDCIQHLGDMDYISDGANTYDGAYAASEVSALPSFYLPGNHEIENSFDPPVLRDKYSGYPDWNKQPGPPGSSSTTYSYDVGDIHVVVLNEYWDGNNNGACDWTAAGENKDDTCWKYGSGSGGYIPDALFDWLKTNLRNSTAPYKIVMGHEPAWPESWQRHDGDSLDQDADNRNKFWNLLQTEKVIAYFCGHTHNYKFQEYDGVFEVDGGVSGGHLSSGDNFATLLYAHYDGAGFVIRAVNEGGPDWTGTPAVTTKGITNLANQILVNTAEGAGTVSMYYVNRNSGHPDWSAYNESRWWEIDFSTEDATGWEPGELCVGYDDDDGAWPWMNTAITSSDDVYGVFQRMNFTVYDKSLYNKLYLGVDYDDAVTVWLNGTEIFKSGNSPTVGTNDIWDKTADGSHGASGQDGPKNPVYTWIDITGYMGNLDNGTNLLAIGNWSNKTTSSDLAAGIKLYLARAAFISSAQNQTFAADGPARAISAITVTESGTATTIRADKDIRIKIPSALHMTWDTSDTKANIGGTDYSKTGAGFQGAEVNVTYEDSNKTVVIPVETNFEPGDDITVYGLSFAKFIPMPAEDNLELITGGSGYPAANSDDKTITITIGLIYPYLQDVTTTSVKVMWITDASSASRVDYGLTGSYGSCIEDPGLVTVHEIPVTGLSPNTIYHYKATSGEMSSADSTFRTAPSSESGFNFIAYGDNRASGSGPVYVTDHEAVINAMVPHNPKTMFINVGDLCYDGSQDEWQPQLFLPARNMLKNTVFYPVIGNHEAGTGFFEDYFEPPEGSGSERYYSFNYGNVHFVILNTNQDYSTGSTQHDWLLSDLDSESATSATWIFVAAHHPPFSTGSHGEDPDVISHLVPVFEDKGVDMYICGHDHFYERSYVNGVYYLVTGGGGAPLRNPGSAADYTEFNKKAFHHCLVDVGAHSIIVTAYGNDGEAFDSFVLPRSTAETVLPGAGKTIVFNSVAGEVRVEISPQTFSESVTITVGTVISFPRGISPVAGLRGTGVGIEIIPDKPVQPLKPIMISIPYRPSDVAGMNEDRLVLAGFDSWDRVWVPLQSTRDTANNRVTARTSHLSIFQIMQVSIEDLSQVTIGPNPLRPSRNPGEVMTFRNLPERARVRIYTLTGELLYDAHESANGTAVWNGRNKSGRQVASGVYIALIEGKGERRRFKLAVQK